MAEKLPTINAVQPVELPAREARTYPNYAVVGFALHTSSDPTPDVLNGQTITIVLRPHSQEAGETYPGTDRDHYERVHVWPEVARSALFGQCMGVLITSCNLLYQERRLKEQRSAALNARQQESLDVIDGLLTDVWRAAGIEPEALPKIEPDDVEVPVEREHFET